MSVQVKICGITSVDAANAAAEAGAHYAGLVFFARSPRFVAGEEASAIALRLRERCRIVALVADASDSEIESAVLAVRPDMLQLHGRESPDRVAAIRSRFDIPVIKAIAIADVGDLADVARYEAVADMLLFDARAPSNAERPGGHGVAFDWKLLSGRTFTRPWLLGGGLTVENVARAIRSSGARCVDCSSGVESSPGVKDAQMICDFIAAARAAEFASEAQP